MRGEFWKNASEEGFDKKCNSLIQKLISYAKFWKLVAGLFDKSEKRNATYATLQYTNRSDEITLAMSNTNNALAVKIFRMQTRYFQTLIKP